MVTLSFKYQVTYKITESTKFKPIRVAYPWIFLIFFLSTLPPIVFLKRTQMHKDQVAVFTLGISICNLVLQSIEVYMWLNPFVFHYLGLIIIYLLICVFWRNSHNKYNTSLCFSLDKMTHDIRRSWFFR